MKHLIKKFGFNSIQLELKKHNWLLPSAQEVKEENIDYKVVWVTDIPPLLEDQKTHACLYNVVDDKLEICNRNHMHSIVVKKINKRE